MTRGKTMNTRKLLAALAVAITMSTLAPRAHAAPAPWTESGPDEREERAERESDLYEVGTEAIDEEQWEDAIRNFTKVAEMKGSKADGAIYWTAYALNKLGRSTEAQKTIDGLAKTYPNSRWLDDAKALSLELRSDRGENVSPSSVDDAD